MTSIPNDAFFNALKTCVLESNTKYQNFLAQNTLIETLHEYGVCKVNVTICLDHHSSGRDCREITIKLDEVNHGIK